MKAFIFSTLVRKFLQFFLRIEVALLNKSINQNIKINDFFIDIESWSTFFKLLGKSALRKAILSRMWRNLRFHVIGILTSGFFLILFACSSLVCVVPSSTAWTFASDVKTLVFPGILVRSISSEAMNSVSESFINSSFSYSFSLCTVCNNANIWSVKVPLSISKYLFPLLLIFQLFTHKIFTNTLQITRLND